MYMLDLAPNNYKSLCLRCFNLLTYFCTLGTCLLTFLSCILSIFVTTHHLHFEKHIHFGTLDQFKIFEEPNSFFSFGLLNRATL